MNTVNQMKNYVPKLDADDQEELARVQKEKVVAAIAHLEEIKLEMPKWDESPSEIGSRIAGEFYPVASLFHADLRREIIKAIESEREVLKCYMETK